MIMLTQFRLHYPQGSLVSDLLAIERDQYLVRVSVQVGGTLLGTAMAADRCLEVAEDRARDRALALLNLPFVPSQKQIPSSPTIPTNLGELARVGEGASSESNSEACAGRQSSEITGVSVSNHKRTATAAVESPQPPSVQPEQAATTIPDTDTPNKIQSSSLPVSPAPELAQPPELTELEPSPVESKVLRRATESPMPSSHGGISGDVESPMPSSHGSYSPSPASRISWDVEQVANPKGKISVSVPEVSLTDAEKSEVPSPIASSDISGGWAAGGSLQSLSDRRDVAERTAEVDEVSLPASTSSIALEPMELAPTIQPETADEAIDFSDVKDRIDFEMKRAGVTVEQGRSYLLETYGKRSRLLLSDDELLEFLQYLQSLPVIARD